MLNNHLWQARIQLDMQYLHIKIHIVFIILKVKIYICIYCIYTLMYIDVYTVFNILTNIYVYIYIKSGFHLCQIQVIQALKH